MQLCQLTDCSKCLAVFRCGFMVVIVKVSSCVCRRSQPVHLKMFFIWYYPLHLTSRLHYAGLNEEKLKHRKADNRVSCCYLPLLSLVEVPGQQNVLHGL